MSVSCLQYYGQKAIRQKITKEEKHVLVYVELEGRILPTETTTVLTVLSR
jgi:hypothetical protein